MLIAAAGVSPKWSRSTQELFYIDDGRLKAVSYQVRDGVFRPSPPSTLFALGRLLPDTTSRPTADSCSSPPLPASPSAT